MWRGSVAASAILISFSHREGTSVCGRTRSVGCSSRRTTVRPGGRSEGRVGGFGRSLWRVFGIGQTRQTKCIVACSAALAYSFIQCGVVANGMCCKGWDGVTVKNGKLVEKEVEEMLDGGHCVGRGCGVCRHVMHVVFPSADTFPPVSSAARRVSFLATRSASSPEPKPLLLWLPILTCCALAVEVTCLEDGIPSLILTELQE